MQYDIERFLKLSGLSEGDSGLLSEGREAQVDGTTQDDDLAEVAQKAETVLAESRIRTAIRRELSALLEEIQAAKDDPDKMSETAKWLFVSMRKPSNSKKGQISRGFFGPGFGGNS